MKSADSHNNQSGVRFVLDCLTAPHSDGGIETESSLDLAAIAKAAYRHGVEPLVGRGLDRISEEKRGQPGARRILTNARAHALRNQYLTQELSVVLGEFDRAGIETLVIKGPVLAELAYGDVALRPFGDLDIVVRASDVPRAALLLVQAGFDPGAYDEAAFRSNFFDAVEANFQRRDERLNVDLHWELSPPSFAFGPGGDGIWRRAITIELSGAKVRTLSHEDHLLYLTVHHARHGWDSLSQLCDIAYFIKRVPIDWGALIARAGATRSTRMIAVALLMAHDHLNATIPATTLATLRREAGAVRIATALGAEMTSDRPPGGGARRLVRILALIERPGDRVRFILRSAFAPTLMDRRFVPLRRDLYPLYFLLRPIRIGAAAIRTLRWSIGARETVDDRFKAV